MVFKFFKIENFRAFSNLELNDLRQINLIVGNNGVGKTSLLEAMFLLLGRKNPQCSVKIQNFRNMFLYEDIDFKFLYNSFKFNKNIFLSAKREDNTNIDLTIEPIFGYKTINKHSNVLPNLMEQNIEQKKIDLEYQNNDILGIKYFFKDTNNINFNLEISIQNPNKIFSYKPEFPGYFFKNTNPIETFGVVSEMNKEKDIISVLQVIDPTIENLKIGKNNMIFCSVKGIKDAVPINLMGDGIIKIISVLSAILTLKGGALFVDEIENGLSYTSQKLLWKAIFTICKDFDVQIFLTTHSEECVRYFIEVSRENSYNDMISLIRLSKEKNQHFTTGYVDEMLDVVYEDKIEVR